MTDCLPRWWGSGVHNFQPRYDEQRTAPEWLTLAVREGTKVNYNGGDLDCKTTYVHDVCSRCGTIVQRPPTK